jgi:hypothetical protein
MSGSVETGAYFPSKSQKALNLHLIRIRRLVEWIQYVLRLGLTVIKDVIATESLRNVALDRLNQIKSTLRLSSFMCYPALSISSNRIRYWSIKVFRSPSQLGKVSKTLITLSLKVKLARFSSLF